MKQKSTSIPAGQDSVDLQQRLLTLFEKLLPLVDSVADKLRFVLLLGVGLLVWIFVWMFFLQGFSLTTALVITGVSLLPLLVILRFWWALEELKDLPDIIEDMLEDAQDGFHDTVQSIRSGEKQAVGLLSSVKKLWSVGALAGEARELLGAYISIGTLANPFALVLGILSLLFILLLLLTSLFLVPFIFF